MGDFRAPYMQEEMSNSGLCEVVSESNDEGTCSYSRTFMRGPKKCGLVGGLPRSQG